MDGERRPGHLRQRSGDHARPRAGSMERQWRRDTVTPLQGGYNGFKIAVAIIVFHFGVKMLEQFADLLLPFIMALLLVTVLEPVKQATLDVLECSFILIFSKACRCCLRISRKSATYGSPDKRPKVEFAELGSVFKKLLMFLSIALTIAFAGRLFWMVGQIIWLSGEAVMHDFRFYEGGVSKRTKQVQNLLERFHLQKSVPTDMEHMGQLALSCLQYAAQFLSQHVFYTVTQVSLTAIFVLFLLWSPVQREFSPVMQGVFQSMETYLKLKTLISAMMGVTNGIALAVIGLELPAAWGLLTFLANFIPNIGGPVISLVPCLISILDERKSLYQVMMAFAAQFMLHFNIANFVEPIIFGNTEEIHSVVVLLGLSFFGFVWGLTGMFLSVPLLFAMHAWLDTIAKRDSYGQEACEDARFIMGILEGRWLATVDEDPHQPGTVNLLTGHIEEEEPWAEREEHEGAMGHSASQEAAPVTSWKCTERCKECLELRDPQTSEVLVLGLLLRWIVMAGTYTFVFFGFWIFHWDLHALIHPSGGQMFNATSHVNVVPVASHVNVVPVVPLSTALPHAEVSTTIAMTMAQVMTMAPHFSFRPEGGSDPEDSDEGSILRLHTTGAPSVDLELRSDGAAAPDDPGPPASESPPLPGSVRSGLKHRKNADANADAAAGNTSSRHGGGPPHLDGESMDEDRSTSMKEEEPGQNLET